MTAHVTELNWRLTHRPRSGSLVVPFMVDATQVPIDFKAVDHGHVERCAREKLCGVCGLRIQWGRDLFAFLGPLRDLQCFGDPWMHEGCADYTAGACPFVSGKRRVWREGDMPSTEVFKGSWMLLIAQGGKVHTDPNGAYHFEPVKVLRTAVFE